MALDCCKLSGRCQLLSLQVLLVLRLAMVQSCTSLRLLAVHHGPLSIMRRAC